MDWKNKLINFWSGRYGADSLGNALFIVSIVLAAVNIFARSLALQVICFCVLILAAIRVFSRNTAARKKENELFMKLFGAVKKKWNLLVRRFRERKTHCFRTCPNCKTELHLPKRKGKHTVCCPCCKHEFSVHVWIL